MKISSSFAVTVLNSYFIKQLLHFVYIRLEVQIVNEMQQAPNVPISSSPKHSNIVLGIVMLGTLMGALDSTIVLLGFSSHK